MSLELTELTAPARGAIAVLELRGPGALQRITLPESLIWYALFLCALWGGRLAVRHDLRRYTEMPRGGHFAAAEQPELFLEDVRSFFRELR